MLHGVKQEGPLTQKKLYFNISLSRDVEHPDQLSLVNEFPLDPLRTGTLQQDPVKTGAELLVL